MDKFFAYLIGIMLAIFFISYIIWVVAELFFQKGGNEMITEKEERIKQGYNVEDYLQPEEVGAYLFELDQIKGGSFVKELTVNYEDGIPEEEFSKVAEVLYDETAGLYTKVAT